LAIIYKVNLFFLPEHPTGSSMYPASIFRKGGLDLDIAKAESFDLPIILKLQYEAYQSEAEIYGEMIPPLNRL